MSKCRKTGDWMTFDPHWRIPKSVTHDSLEEGCKRSSNIIRIVARKQLNFQSYPMNDFRFDLITFDKPKKIQSISTYMRDYVQPLPSKCKPRNIHDVESPDPLFNRRTVTDFEMVPWVDSKFMDDKIFMISEQRKRIFFFRELDCHLLWKTSKMSKCRKSGDWMTFDPHWRTPKSVTHESLEEGYTRSSNVVRMITRKQLNFQSYPMDDFRFDLINFDKPKKIQIISTYMRDYVQPYPPKCKPRNIHDVDSPDPLFNRRTVTDFEMVPWVNTKFMDDKIFMISEQRKRINFFRQLRNRSFEFA